VGPRWYCREGYTAGLSAARCVASLAVPRAPRAGARCQSVTATMQGKAEQRSRDANTQHCLSRLAEHQAAVAEARVRETALTEEKKSLTLEAQRLRQDLRNAQSEITGRFANPGSSPTPAMPEEPASSQIAGPLGSALWGQGVDRLGGHRRAILDQADRGECHRLSGHGIDDNGRNIGVGSGRSSRPPSTTDTGSKP